MLKGSILEKLETARSNRKTPLNLGVYYKNTLIALCHALEDFVLESDSSPIMVTAFQQGKWYLQEADRYGEIAQKASHIAIMATPDSGFESHPTSKSPKISLVKLKTDDPVAQEWHLMILSPTYTAMVVCQELSDADYGSEGRPQEDKERKFYGFWTFEPELVRETVELAIDRISLYDRELAKNLTAKIEAMSPSKQKEDLGAVVSKVVKYLQASKKVLSNTEELSEVSFSEELDNNLVSNELQAFLRMAQLIELADTTNPTATSEIVTLAEAMGQLLDLPAWQIKRLRLAGLLHRLGSLQVVTQIEKLKSRDSEEATGKKESEAKRSLLRIMPQLQAVSRIITYQSECWDGSGVPESLAYDNIPLESRILRLIVEFQKRLQVYKQGKVENPLSQALGDCKNLAGTTFDPKLVEALSLLVIGMQQGMSITVSIPKIAGGIWLLDSYEEQSA